VPVHLITREAFEIYFRHLKPGGLLAVNITNAYLDLRRVVERAANHFGKIAIHYSDEPIDNFVCFPSDWVLIADPSIRESAPKLAEAGQALGPSAGFRLWTDDFSNLWSILK
jgi:spermidine synthase